MFMTYMRTKFVLDRQKRQICLSSLCLSQVLDKKNVWGKNTRCDVYLNHLLVLWSRRNYNIFRLKSQWRVSSWLLWRLRVSLRVCFVLKLFSHTSSPVLLLTQMRNGISRGDEMMSTVFLLNSVSYFSTLLTECYQCINCTQRSTAM